MRWLSLVVLLSACIDTAEDDVAGLLVRVEVSIVADTCSAPRFTGDAGVQFYAVRPDGGVVLTMAQHAQFGPLIDGGWLESVHRQVIPTPDSPSTRIGNEAACEGSFTNWQVADGGLSLAQRWPGRDECPSGPFWLPSAACTTERRFVFTEVGTCQLRCVRLSTRGEVDCGC